MDDSRAPAITVRLRILKYLLPLLCASGLLMMVGIAICRCDFYLTNPAGNIVTLGLTALKFHEKVDADIVFVGDSTALFGIVPAVVEKETGLKTHNLALTINAFIYGERFLLQDYLRRNKPPKYIILSMNPWTQPTQEKAGSDTRYEEGFVTVRYGAVRDIAGFFYRKPSQLFLFPIHTLNVVGQFLTAGASESPMYREMRSQLAANSGYLQMNLMGSHVDTTPYDCAAEGPAVEPDRQYIADFVRRYSSHETKVLVFMAPQPECQKRLASFRQQYEGLADRPPEGLPVDYFAPGTTSGHLRTKGALQNSLLVGQLIHRIDMKSPETSKVATGGAIR